MGRVVLVAWVITVAVSYLLLDDFLAKLIEGYDRAALSKLPAVVTAASALVSLLLTARWAMTRKTRPDGTQSGRRGFLLGTAAAAGGLVATVLAPFQRNRDWLETTVLPIFAVRPPYQADTPKPAWKGSRVGRYRRLGRTDAMVSDISIGSGSSTGGRQTTDVVREAIDRGVNYFDTAPVDRVSSRGPANATESRCPQHEPGAQEQGTRARLGDEDLLTL